MITICTQAFSSHDQFYTYTPTGRIFYEFQFPQSWHSTKAQFHVHGFVLFALMVDMLE